MRCPTKMKIWKDTCPVKEEKLFPALQGEAQSLFQKNKQLKLKFFGKYSLQF